MTKVGVELAPHLKGISRNAEYWSFEVFGTFTLFFALVLSILVQDFFSLLLAISILSLKASKSENYRYCNI